MHGKVSAYSRPSRQTNAQSLLVATHLFSASGFASKLADTNTVVSASAGDETTSSDEWREGERPPVELLTALHDGRLDSDLSSRLRHHIKEHPRDQKRLLAIEMTAHATEEELRALALGTAGNEVQRARVISHVQGCKECSARLAWIEVENDDATVSATP